MAENTRDDVVCCRLVWLLPGRRDDRPVDVDGAVLGKEDGAGKVILGAVGCSAAEVEDASAGVGDLASGDLACDSLAGRCSFSSSSGSASISASSSSSSCSCSARVCFFEPPRVFLAGAGEGDLGCC